MAYTLTLTKGEREAMDWVGNRYRHGNELWTLLWCDCDQTPEGAEWEGDGDITFQIDEHVAWMISEIINDGLDCFGDDLRAKLHAFRDSVV